jgi:hypothetical protein
MKRPRVPLYDPPPAKHSTPQPTSSTWHAKLLKAQASLPTPTPSDPIIPEDILEDQQWRYNEAEFHLQQAKLRSHIRLEQGRETPFDLCLQLQRIYLGEIDVSAVPAARLPAEVFEPHLVLEVHSRSQLEAVRGAIEVHMGLEKADWAEYWKALAVLCQERIHLLSAQEEAEEKRLKYYTIHGLAQDIYEDLDKILREKDENDLKSLQSQIETMLKDHSAAIDRTYWEGMLTQTLVYIAKEALRCIANLFLQLKNVSEKDQFDTKIGLKELILYRGLEVEPDFDPDLSPVLRPMSEESELSFGAVILSEEEDKIQQITTRNAILEKEIESFLLSAKRLDPGSNALIAENSSRFSIVRTEKLRTDSMDKTMEDLARMELLKNLPLEDGEEEFGQIVDLKPVLETWMSKYHPRKPKFFNRVKTGYEWNRYNQTHYDHSSPPPKVVQGYKFNLFYPDLIDKTKAPQFYLEPCEDSDLCVIRFHAGPPYEDIAFQIVSREWDFSERRGFKNFFDRGVLHLYLNFKRHRYKR